MITQLRVALADEPVIQQVYFVIQRANGHWSPAAKVIAVYDAEHEADDHAAKLKDQHPQQSFGVASLRSEARLVAHPIEIVRAQ